VLKVIHLTDPHLPPPGETLYGLDPNARLEAAIADINAHHRDAELILMTGDLAKDGEPASYAALRRALNRLEAPYRLLMGNHDDRASFRAAFPDHPADAAGFVQSVCETPAGAFVLLDTLDPGVDGGRLCPTRLDWLEASLRGLAGGSVFLAMHHPAGPIGMPTLDRIGLVEPDAFWRLIARSGQVTIRHIFCGHVHRLTHGAWRGIPFSTQRSLIHQFAASLAPEDHRIIGTHEPPAYSIALIDPDWVAIHVHEFLDESPRFDPADRAARSATSPSGLPVLASRQER
jgi:3',5'-cyclic-AMP phosphodiesterase